MAWILTALRFSRTQISISLMANIPTPQLLQTLNFCLGVCEPNATILVHDNNITSRALWHIADVLRQKSAPFIARKVGGVTFSIFLGCDLVLMDSYIRAVSTNGRYWL
jgi:hypothetical protein